MCGITGYLGHGDQATLKRMTDAIAHRGPDDDGFFIDRELGFGFRRLSIIDVAGGRQPMFNEDRKVAVIFNGEIYNYPELRDQLRKKGHTFATTSDTEVIVHGYEEFGPKIFSQINGMFAIALWDVRTRELLLARDRLGKKPLYYGTFGGTLVFGSELKALLQHPTARRELDYASLAKYLVFEYVPTPHSMLRRIRKLPEGAYAQVRSGEPVQVHRYWDLTFCSIVGKSNRHPERRLSRPESKDLTPTSIEGVGSLGWARDDYAAGGANIRSEAEAAHHLDHLLADAVKRRLVADVPLGVFLSGGIDSSAVTYYAQAASSTPVKTFSVGFADPSFDESRYAKLVANHLHTEHHHTELGPQDALDLVPKLADLMDEPLADASLLPTYLLSKFTRQHVTVAVGGDGGDELFLGYPTFQAERWYQMMRWLPSAVRHGLARGVHLLPASFGYLSFDFKLKRFSQGLLAPDDLRHQTWLGSATPSQLSDLLTTQARSSIGAGDVYADLHARLSQVPASASVWQRLTYEYLKGYLMDQVLVKVDRASMFASLEVRAPLLDYRVVEYVANLPDHLKLRGSTTKYLLKKLMAGKLPDEIIHRRKQGFAIPIAQWLAGELQPLARELLAPDRLKAQGIFNPEYVTRLLDEHTKRRADHRKLLWTLLCFQLWYDRWLP